MTDRSGRTHLGVDVRDVATVLGAPRGRRDHHHGDGPGIGRLTGFGNPLGRSTLGPVCVRSAASSAVPATTHPDAAAGTGPAPRR
ncbi:MAG: hypothetical protein JOY78_00855 [Pseudonocardia sp.]|nr:hypothetical protein [Pseudonocardia sp.]